MRYKILIQNICDGVMKHPWEQTTCREIFSGDKSRLYGVNFQRFGHCPCRRHIQSLMIEAWTFSETFQIVSHWHDWSPEKTLLHSVVEKASNQDISGIVWVCIDSLRETWYQMLLIRCYPFSLAGILELITLLDLLFCNSALPPPLHHHLCKEF